MAVTMVGGCRSHRRVGAVDSGEGWGFHTGYILGDGVSQATATGTGTRVVVARVMVGVRFDSALLWDVLGVRARYRPVSGRVGSTGKPWRACPWHPDVVFGYMECRDWAGAWRRRGDRVSWWIRWV